MEKISLVIFDMDGLMFDTERINILAWQKVGMDYGLEISESVIMEAIGLNVIETEKIFTKHFGKDFPYWDAKEKRVQYAIQYVETNGVPVKKGVFELLEFLGEKKILKAVATSTERAHAERNLSLAGVLDKFDLIVCGDEVAKSKPEPDIFLTAAKKLNCDVNTCIVLEDSENGIKAASRAGMVPILVPDIKMPSPEVRMLAFKEFKSLLEVKKYLEGILV